MGGWCHHENGQVNWCGWISCHPEPDNVNVGYPECCDISAQGCGGVKEATAQLEATSKPSFGTGKPVGSDVEIAVMNGADGEKTTLETAQAGAASGAQGLLLVVVLFGTIYWLTGLKKDRG